MTKDDLRQYDHLLKEIETLQAEVIRVRESLSIVQQLSDMPKSKNERDRIADTIAKIVDLETEIHTRIRLAIDLRGEIEAAIDSLPVQERLLIRLHYVDGLSWVQVAHELKCSWRQTHRLHGWALQKIIIK